MSRNITIFIVVVLVVISAGVVAAQDDGDNTFPFGFGWMHQGDNDHFRNGMMQGGFGMHGGFGHGMMWGEGETMMNAVAEALGLEPEAFFTALGEGQTLAEIAEAQGVELDSVYDVMLAQGAAHMAELVEAGTITQEQAAERLTWMQENFENMPMFSGGGFGPWMGGQAGFDRHNHRGGWGMMGAGHGSGMMGR